MRCAFLLRPSVLVSVVAHGALVAAAIWTVRSTDAGSSPASIDVAFFEAGTAPPEEAPELDTAERDPAEGPIEPDALPEPVIIDAAPPTDETLLDPVPAAEAPPSDVFTPRGSQLNVRVRRTAPVVSSASARAAPASSGTSISLSNRGHTAVAYRLPTNAPPEYPAVALRSGWQGTALVRLTIEADGTISRATLEWSSGWRLLDEAAVTAASSWQYSPRLEGGVAIASTIVQPVEFLLR